MANPKVWLIYIYGLISTLFAMFIKCLGAKFKFGLLMLSKDYKNSYRIDKVLVKSANMRLLLLLFEKFYNRKEYIPYFLK